MWPASFACAVPMPVLLPTLNAQVHRAGAHQMVEADASVAPAPVQPLVRRRCQRTARRSCPREALLEWGKGSLLVGPVIDSEDNAVEGTDECI